MGWIEFNLCIGLRIDLAETSLGSVEELCAILDDIRADTSHERSRTIGDLCVSSLKTNFKGTEFELSHPKYDENLDEYLDESFGGITDKDRCYMLYFKRISLDNSNGCELNTNMVYSSGHLEFYHGCVQESLDPTTEQVDLFQEIARRANMGYQLNWSLRARGSWAKTQVWPPQLVKKDT
eukprot:gene17226-12318_t